MHRIREIGELVCRERESIREVLGRINASIHLFQIVLDAQGGLLGTITDGDVRRAILRDVTLDDPVAECMNREPVTGTIGDEAENVKRLRAIGGLRAFLPLLDAEGIVRAVLVAKREEASSFAALVMAGGRGSRLGERTRDVPKPLLPVGEKPILEHVLKKLEAAGVTDIHVAVHYLADQIEAYVKGRKGVAAVQIIRETIPLGTAGAISRVSTDGLPLLILNGDILTNVDIAALAGFHERHEFDGTVAVAQHEVSIPFGVIRRSEDGTFLGVEEKPASTHFVAAGMYYLSPNMAALVPPSRPMNMPELLNLGRSIGMRIGLFPIHEYWRDVGRPEDLVAADQDHAEAP